MVHPPYGPLTYGLISSGLGLRGRSITLPPLGSVSSFDQALEVIVGPFPGDPRLQPSVVAVDMLPDLRCEMRLTVDRATEGDYVLEAAGPSNRFSFRAPEDRTHFLWQPANFISTGGVSFTPLSVCAFISDFSRLGVCFFTFINCTLLLPEKGFMSFRAHQGRKLFDAFEESIQERPFWLDDEGTPFPWVYRNFEVGDYRITALHPLETLAFEFLQSLSASLGKKSKFKCLWILDHGDVGVGDAEVEGAGPHSILPTHILPAASAGASASSPSLTVAFGSFAGAIKAKNKVSAIFIEKPISLEEEEGVKEDPAVDLSRKGGNEKSAFPAGFNFRSLLDAGLTAGPVREILGPVIPEELLGTAQGYACKLAALLQVGIENAFAAKLKIKKELPAAKDQVAILTAERDCVLTSPPLQAEVDSLTEQLRLAKGECLSALAWMSELEEENKAMAVELQSSRSALLLFMSL
ncbi:hypothetical protein PIB30_044120 [Stylosanthes scabra]|uniref:Uncharacterized protein n=1 Tax=Stylosanthes scabra TaxID=79078 RepID=A0ABU6SHB1_9FABA|nr:hypothetical protein [Stylosanthes scabra]